MPGLCLIPKISKLLSNAFATNGVECLRAGRRCGQVVDFQLYCRPNAVVRRNSIRNHAAEGSSHIHDVTRPTPTLRSPVRWEPCDADRFFEAATALCDREDLGRGWSEGVLGCSVKPSREGFSAGDARRWESHSPSILCEPFQSAARSRRWPLALAPECAESSAQKLASVHQLPSRRSSPDHG